MFNFIFLSKMTKRSFNLRKVATIVACLVVTTMFAACDTKIGDDDENGGGENSTIVGGTLRLTGNIHLWDGGGHPGTPIPTALTPLRVSSRFANYNGPIYFSSYGSQVVKSEGGIVNSYLDFSVIVEKLNEKIPSLLSGLYNDLKYTPDNTLYFHLHALDVKGPWFDNPGPNATLEKWSAQSLSSTTCIASKVHYIYVDRDVTITGKDKVIGDTTYKGFTLKFKKGWNEYYEEFVWLLPPAGSWGGTVTLSNTPFASTYYWVVDS